MKDSIVWRVHASQRGRLYHAASCRGNINADVVSSSMVLNPFMRYQLRQNRFVSPQLFPSGIRFFTVFWVVVMLLSMFPVFAYPNMPIWLIQYMLAPNRKHINAMWKNLIRRASGWLAGL